MPSLNWIGKEAVVNHDKEVPFKLLKKVKQSSVGENSENLIIHGDNLEALKALMPHYISKVKCIYIDPPYNTGNEGWVYNDKVNSPKIKQWLGRVVGRESEDLTRHDKWLCMMYPRLKLLRDLLRDDGVIFVSLDETEFHHLRMIMDEIFGESNFLADISWEKRFTRSNNAKLFATVKEHLLVYRKSDQLKTIREPRSEKADSTYLNPDNDPRGLWTSVSCVNPASREARPNLSYEMINPITRKKVNHPTNAWKFNKVQYKKYVEEDKLYWGKNGTNKYPRLKKFLSEMNEGMVPVDFWNHKETGTTDEGTKNLQELFKDKVFENPKPVRMIKRALKLATDKDSIVLDSFAGSGTTGHAVLDLNKEDGGNRKFVLVEMEDKVAKDITAERVRRAVNEYNYDDGFEYCELTKPLFDEDGQIEKACDFKQFATYLYFTETQTNIDPFKISGNFIGEHQDTDYYLIYKGNEANTLNRAFLKKLQKNDKKKIVYADRCTLGDGTLERNNVIFKQIPYEVRVY